MPESDKGVRKVYVLPQELYSRLVSYQMRNGFSSEVEAVRTLLDSALKSTDTYRMMIDTFLEVYANANTLASAAKETLAGHPLVTKIEFNPRSVVFGRTDGVVVRINSNMTWTAEDEAGRTIQKSEPPKPKGIEDLDDDDLRDRAPDLPQTTTGSSGNSRK
jgi:hypothetical protein